MLFAGDCTDGFVPGNRGHNRELGFIHCVIFEVLTNASEEPLQYDLPLI
jgi:hypothetical protein